MLASSDRTRPCSALLCFSSSGRVTTSSFLAASCATLIAGWTFNSSLPLGPSIFTSWPEALNFTPLARGTGFLPIRLMAFPLAHGAKQFTADVLLAGAAVAHHALARAHHRDAHAIEHV